MTAVVTSDVTSDYFGKRKSLLFRYIPGVGATAKKHQTIAKRRTLRLQSPIIRLSDAECHGKGTLGRKIRSQPQVTEGTIKTIEC